MFSILINFNVIKDRFELRCISDKETVLKVPLGHNHYSLAYTAGVLSRDHLIKLKKVIENHLEKTEIEE